MSQKPRAYDESDRYTPRQNDRYIPNRYERDDQQYEDRYARASEWNERFEKRVKKIDVEEKQKADKKSEGPSVATQILSFTI